MPPVLDPIPPLGRSGRHAAHRLRALLIAQGVLPRNVQKRLGFVPLLKSADPLADPARPEIASRQANHAIVTASITEAGEALLKRVDYSPVPSPARNGRGSSNGSNGIEHPPTSI
jgi:hypothetical protein